MKPLIIKLGRRHLLIILKYKILGTSSEILEILNFC